MVIYPCFSYIIYIYISVGDLCGVVHTEDFRPTKQQTHIHKHNKTHSSKKTTPNADGRNEFVTHCIVGPCGLSVSIICNGRYAERDKNKRRTHTHTQTNKKTTHVCKQWHRKHRSVWGGRQANWIAVKIAWAPNTCHTQKHRYTHKHTSTWRPRSYETCERARVSRDCFVNLVHTTQYIHYTYMHYIEQPALCLTAGTFCCWNYGNSHTFCSLLARTWYTAA